MKNNDPTVPNVLKTLAHTLGATIKDRKLVIPRKFGSGYCTGFVFNQHIRMLISNYELTEEIIVANDDLHANRRMLFFKFQNIFPSAGMPSVLIATSRINTDDMIAIHSNKATINIEIDADYLKGLFYSSDRSPVLQSLLQNTRPFLFDQMIYPSLQEIINAIVANAVDETFQLFFLRVKAEELICRLLIELEKRDEQRLYALNSQDIATIYKIKEHMLQHLDTPPLISELAVRAGMSATKLKRLFRQIFGNSLFHYYQSFRMKEASLLLKDKRLSVADVGYRLGFTNLGHFSRIFKEHIGMKPKQYAMM